MSRVFLDANVLFSAAISPGGVARAIFELSDQRRDRLELVATGYALKEAFRNLERKRPDDVGNLLGLIDGMWFAEEPPEGLADRLQGRVPDPKDLPILAGAVWAEADLLVTGNSKDFRDLYGEHVGGCLVLRPRNALDLLLSLAEED